MIFILSLPLAFALYGGETWRYHFEYCEELKVNITATEEITEGEYIILNNCTKNYTNYYICDCNDDYNFNVTFKINTVNNYTFHFNYDYSKEIMETQEPDKKGSTRGGSSIAFTIRFQENKSRIFMLNQNIISRFWINGEQHTIKLIEIFNNTIELELRSEPIKIILKLNESKQIQMDNETLELTLKEIRGRVAFIEFEKLQKYPSISDEKPIDINKTTEEVVEEKIVPEEFQGEVIIEFPEEERKINIGLIIIIAIIVIGLIVYFIIAKKKTNR